MSILLGSSSKIPAPPPPPKAPPPPPTPQDPAVIAGRKRDRQIAALAAGRSSTVLTSGLGLTGDAPSSARKTALGA